ncbi:MAG TPA: LysR family transcriptional regulator [Brevibacterium senegalense]|uniref:LysR family transcriptional regulator n=1 Tax=Brevibacterium senegalense TaxID=1033736 RepID=A0A921MGL2_9MICO|nr:LysR family transcriptional regulator [Brevibacterium senegalense]
MDFPFTLNQLRYFNEVARHESMRIAAEELHVSQSAVSTAIAQLERSLHVQLFIRQRNRSVTLSPAGRRFAAKTRTFLASAESLGEQGALLGGTLTGRLTVGVYAPIAPFRFPRVLTSFEEQHPGVDVDLIAGNLEEIRSSLVGGDCEIALMYAHGLGPGFETRVLETVRPHVFVSSTHPLADRGSVHLAEFADEPFIQLDFPYSRDYYDQLFRLVGVAPDVRYRFNDYETVRSFAAMGHGYALLNQNPTPATYSGAQLVALDLRDELPPIEVIAVWPEHTRLTIRARAFVRSCMDHYLPEE